MSKEIMPTEREKEIAQKQVEREKEIAQKQVERDAVIDSWETDGGSTNGGPTINALKQKESASTGKERLTAFRLKLVGFFRSIGAFIGQHKSQPRH
jgi:hypothetical protein